MQLGIEDVHRYSLDQYHRLIETGEFEDARVELLDGVLVAISAKTPRHERALIWLNRWLVRSLDDDRYEVGVGSPLTLATSEPEPDFAMFERGTPAPYHPATGGAGHRDRGVVPVP